MMSVRIMSILFLDDAGDAVHIGNVIKHYICITNKRRRKTNHRLIHFYEFFWNISKEVFFKFIQKAILWQLAYVSTLEIQVHEKNLEKSINNTCLHLLFLSIHLSLKGYHWISQWLKWRNSEGYFILPTRKIKFGGVNYINDYANHHLKIKDVT